jgi:hypothetical protein
MALHATRLGFAHPAPARRCAFDSPLAADLAKVAHETTWRNTVTP